MASSQAEIVQKWLYRSLLAAGSVAAVAILVRDR
jgi:hypothetical protein